MEVQKLTIETWTWWSVGIVLIGGRMLSKWLQCGIKGYQIEDYLMIFVIVTYTTTVILLNKAYLQTNIDVPIDGGSNEESAETIAAQVLGSKLALVLSESMLITMWLTKACMLLLYHRLTSLLNNHIFVNIAAAYCMIGFVSIQILLLGVWCRPLSQYWAVPVENEQCVTYQHHLLYSAVWTISADLLIMGISMPMLVKLRIPLIQKVTLCAVFGFGLFTVVTSCVCEAFYLTNPFSPNWPFWSVRECSTAVFVANLPYWWALLKRIIPLSMMATSHSNSTLTDQRFELPTVNKHSLSDGEIAAKTDRTATT